MICSKCEKDVENAARLKKVAVLADRFFRKQSKEIVEEFYSDFKGNYEFIVESLDPEEQYEIIEYCEDSVVDEEVWAEEVFPCAVEEIKEDKKTYSPRKSGGGRQVHHQCECGIIFSSNHRLRNHIRVKHEFIAESELLPCVLCDKKLVELFRICSSIDSLFAGLKFRNISSFTSATSILTIRLSDHKEILARFAGKSFLQSSL